MLENLNLKIDLISTEKFREVIMNTKVNEIKSLKSS